jgi:ribosome maturation factor RimP
MTDPLEREIEARIEELGFELVELERAGSKARPILSIRIDRVADAPDPAVTIDDCKQVSRGLEAWLDEREGLSERYVLEVSSPGVERPLVRPRDFERFAGQEIALLGRRELHAGSKRVEGVLVGLRSADGDEQVVVRLADGSEVAVPRAQTKKIHLVFRWGSSRT